MFCGNSARAYDRTLTIGSGVHYAHLFGQSPSPGVGANVDVAYGVAPGWDVRASVLAAQNGSLDGFGAFAAAEIVYSIDVISIVPWLGAGLSGGVYRPQGTYTFGVLGGTASVGFDYLLSRAAALGPFVRATIHAVGFDAMPATLEGGVRLALLWEP